VIAVGEAVLAKGADGEIGVTSFSPLIDREKELPFFPRGRSASVIHMSAHIAGELTWWPTKERMAAILRDAGLRVQVGRYSVHVQDCSHFVFQEYGGDLGGPTVDADAETVEELMREGRLVSDALARAGVRHRFEIYDDRDALCGYLHHGWPVQERS